MTVYTTSGTTGKPKHFNLSDEQMAARVATINDTTRGAGFSALKSIFVDFHPSSIIGARYHAYGQKNGVKIVFPSLGTTEATLAMLIKDGIEGIASTPSGMLNYATASKRSYKPTWMMVSTTGLSGARLGPFEPGWAITSGRVTHAAKSAPSPSPVRSRSKLSSAASARLCRVSPCNSSTRRSSANPMR